MATGQASKVIEQLRRAVLLHDGAAMTDGELLGCFIEHREEAAFAALVRRHAPMVWGVCRRLLDHHDAEDAFQATFLVLARKAATVVPREMLANWLYGVAHQAALHARRTVARRRARERQVMVMPEPAAAAEQDSWDDLRPLLDQELSRLPDKYRVVLVLSDLEGKTRGEAARQLGLPEGTVASRLTRARAMLAKRLAQRGVALSGGALAAVLSRDAVAAGVPASVVSSTIKAATLAAAGQTAATGLISVKVAALTEGVLKSMLMTKLKSTAAVLLLVGVLGAGGLVYGTHATPQAGDSGHEYAMVKKEKTAKGQDATRQGRQPPTAAAPDPHEESLEKAIENGAWLCPVQGDPEAVKEFIEWLQKERRKRAAPAAPVAMRPDRLKEVLKRADKDGATWRCPMGGPVDEAELKQLLKEFQQASKEFQEKSRNS